MHIRSLTDRGDVWGLETVTDVVEQDASFANAGVADDY